MQIFNNLKSKKNPLEFFIIDLAEDKSHYD